MKEANCPFGYAMKDGQIVVDETEKSVIERIYTDYLERSSAEQLATALNSAGIPYKKGRSWNKNIIYRILDDARYFGKDGYPIIIIRKKWESVAQKRKSNATEYMDSSFLEIRRKMACGHCEGALIRNKQKRKAAWWECKNCRMQTLIIPDANIQQLVFEKIDRLVQHPEVICSDMGVGAANFEIVKLKREFERLLASSETHVEELDELAKQITQLSYQSIDPQNQTYRTEQILKKLNEMDVDQKEESSLLRLIVSKVLVDETGGMQLKLINGQVI